VVVRNEASERRDERANGHGSSVERRLDLVSPPGATAHAVPSLDGLALGRLLGRLPIGIVSLDPTLAVEYFNPAALDYLGCGAVGELLPDPWPVFSLRKFAGRLFSEVPPPRRIVETESGRLLELDGIPAEEGPNALLLIHDVTARERRSRAEHEFVINAAHELRTPIAAIGGAIEVLQKGAKGKRADRDLFLGHIERESNRLGRLAAALLLLARIQTGHGVTALAVVEVRPLLEDVVRQLEPGDGVELRISCEPGLSVLADRDLLQQAVLNIAANAVRHTREGEVELACHDLGQLREIEVRDTGPGIAERDRERLFDRFFRVRGAKSTGSGLGLAISREIAHALGGTIELDSTVGSGTRVRLRLPAARLVQR
jgi:signal transduction histidine kinase